MKKHCKAGKLSAVFGAIFFVVLSAASCAQTEESSLYLGYSSFDNREQLTQEDAMARATHIIVGEYSGSILASQADRMFVPKKIIKGVVSDEEREMIYVTIRGKAPQLTKGKEYLLILEEHISVYDDHNNYIVLGNDVLPADDPRFEHSLERAAVIAKETKDTTPSGYGNNYSSSYEMKDLISFASYIFEIKAEDVFAESTIGPTTVYDCSVTSLLKGKPENTGWIKITSFNGLIEVGERYIVLLADASLSAPVYTLAGKQNCVIPVGKIAQYPELAELMAQTEGYFSPNETKSDEEILKEEQEYIQKN